MRSTERTEASSRLSLVLSVTHLLDTLGDRQKLRQWVENLEFEDFLQTVSGLNNTIVNNPRHTEALADDQMRIGSHWTTSYFAPRQSDQGPLLQRAFEASKQLIEQRREREAGLLLYFCIQAIHPFRDGNGRTGRALFLMLQEPMTTHVRETLTEFIDGGAGQEIFRNLVKSAQEINGAISEFIADEFLGVEFRKEFGRISFTGLKYEVIDNLARNEHILEETKTELLNILSEDQMGIPFAPKDLALVSVLADKKLVKKYQRLPQFVSDIYITLSGEHKPEYIFAGSELLKDIDEIDAQKIISRFWQIKRRNVEFAIDSIQNPTTYPHPQNHGKTFMDFMYAY